MKQRAFYSEFDSRFTSVDPLASQSPHQNPFHYSSNNPINRTDPTGMKDGPSGDAPKAGGGKGDNLSAAAEAKQLGIKGTVLEEVVIEPSKVTGTTSNYDPSGEEGAMQYSTPKSEGPSIGQQLDDWMMNTFGGEGSVFEFGTEFTSKNAPNNGDTGFTAKKTLEIDSETWDNITFGVGQMGKQRPGGRGPGESPYSNEGIKQKRNQELTQQRNSGQKKTNRVVDPESEVKSFESFSSDPLPQIKNKEIKKNNEQSKIDFEIRTLEWGTIDKNGDTIWHKQVDTLYHR